MPFPYQCGNTIRLSHIFVNNENIKFVPDFISITFMNYKHEVLQTFTLDEFNANGIGEYFFDYTLPYEETGILYEWYGEKNDQVYRKSESMVVSFV